VPFHGDYVGVAKKEKVGGELENEEAPVTGAEKEARSTHTCQKRRGKKVKEPGM
jgi:hypothetical protein